MLMNLSKQIPEIFYIFVNQFKSATYHNYKTIKQFSSGAFSAMSVDNRYVDKYSKDLIINLPYEPCSIRIDKIAVGQAR